jgi:hypothetical protein
MAGMGLITALGWLMHYLYEWSGRHLLAGLFFPVNESVWEHLKLAYWGLMLFVLLEYPALGQKVRHYFSTKLAGLLIIVSSILGIYYSYHLLLDHNILVLDIGSFVAGVALCQWFCWRMFIKGWTHPFPETVSKILLLGMGFLFALFTLYPPKQKIFRDRNTNSYGLPDSNEKK